MSVGTESILMSARNERSKLDSFFEKGCIFFPLPIFNFKFYRPLVCYKRTNFYKLVTFLNMSNRVFIIVLFVICDRDIYYDLYIDTFDAKTM